MLLEVSHHQQLMTLSKLARVRLLFSVDPLRASSLQGCIASVRGVEFGRVAAQHCQVSASVGWKMDQGEGTYYDITPSHVNIAMALKVNHF